MANKNIIIGIAILLSDLCILIFDYFVFEKGVPSFFEFFNWIFELYKAEYGDSYYSTSNSFYLECLPLIALFLILSTVIYKIIAIKKLGSELYLKRVNFTLDRVYFFFNKRQCDFVSYYNEIERLKIIIKTAEVTTRYGVRLVVSEIALRFTVFNNKNFTIVNSPLNPMKFLYSVIDYARNIPDFSFEYEGAGEYPSMSEKLEDYYKYGVKQILSDQEEKDMEILSILFFVIGLIFVKLYFKSLYEQECYIFAYLLFLPIIVSFICDFVLVLDRLRERRYHVVR